LFINRDIAAPIQPRHFAIDLKRARGRDRWFSRGLHRLRRGRSGLLGKCRVEQRSRRKQKNESAAGAG
jgi:hypothetical protein